VRLALFYRDLHGPGGVPREFRQLSAAMARHVEWFQAHSIADRVATIVDEPPAFDHVIHKGGRGRRDSLRAPRGFAASLTANRVDAVIVVSSFVPENSPVVSAAARAGVPVVVAPVHGFDPPMFDRPGGWKRTLYAAVRECRIMRRAVGVRVHSDAQIPPLQRRCGVDPSRCFVVKCGPDWGLLRAQAPELLVDEPWRLTEGEPLTFAVLGRFDVYQKGLDVLLPAWRAYVESGGAGELLFAGNGTPAQTRAFHDLLRDVPSARVLPRQENGDQFRFLARATYAITLSRYEAIPRAATEALSVGCPLIVTAGTNMHDVVAEFEAGFVTSVDHDTVVATLHEAASAHAQRPVLGAYALALARALDWDACGKRFVDEIERRLA
jgi:glycosyltransferase involved in cell wall biosynthesis